MLRSALLFASILFTYVTMENIPLLMNIVDPKYKLFVAVMAGPYILTQIPIYGISNEIAKGGSPLVMTGVRIGLALLYTELLKERLESSIDNVEKVMYENDYFKIKMSDILTIGTIIILEFMVIQYVNMKMEKKSNKLLPKNE